MKSVGYARRHKCTPGVVLCGTGIRQHVQCHPPLVRVDCCILIFSYSKASSSFLLISCVPRISLSLITFQCKMKHELVYNEHATSVSVIIHSSSHNKFIQSTCKYHVHVHADTFHTLYTFLGGNLLFEWINLTQYYLKLIIPIKISHTVIFHIYVRTYVRKYSCMHVYTHTHTHTHTLALAPFVV